MTSDVETDQDNVAECFRLLSWALDERMRRLLAAAEAQALGQGGISAVSRATGVSRRAIHAGIKELQAGNLVNEEEPWRTRRSGGGRKKLIDKSPTLMATLEGLMEPIGQFDSPIRWTAKSTRQLAHELKQMGYGISHTSLANLLEDLGYKVKSPTKASQVPSHVDRHAQFTFLSHQVFSQLSVGNPVISVEMSQTTSNLISASAGTVPQDYASPGESIAIDSGQRRRSIFDARIAQERIAEARKVTKRDDCDTTALALSLFEFWWQTYVSLVYPNASEILLVSNGGESNGAHSRLWKLEIQRLADSITLPISFCHKPPATTRWYGVQNQIRSSVTTWMCGNLVEHEVILSLIGPDSNNLTDGSKIKRDLRATSKISDEDLFSVNLRRNSFHAQWNYSIYPRKDIEKS